METQKQDLSKQILAEYEIRLIYEELDPEEVFMLGFLKALQGNEDLKEF